MKIIDELLSEDCFDGNFIKEFTVDRSLTEDWIIYLEQFGKVQCLTNLEKPFYSFDKKYFFTIKGLLNENKIKVIFRRNNMDLTIKFFDALIDYYNSSTNNIQIVQNIEKKILKTIEK